MLAGGGALGVDDPAVALAALTVEFGFLEPWAVALEGGLQTDRRNAEGATAVVVGLQWATLSLRRSFFAEGMRGLHVSLGLQYVHLSGSAQGASNASVKDVSMPGAALNLEWRQPITAGLFLLARFNLQARLRPQSFFIENSTARVTVAPWGFGLEGGIGWNFL